MNTLAQMIVSAVALIAPMGIVAILYRASKGSRSGVVLAVGGFFAAWFAVVNVLGIQGRLLGSYLGSERSGVPVVSAVGVVLVVAVLAIWLLPGLRRLIEDADAKAGLVALQTYRIAGIAFLIAMLGGQLPAIFAIPAGVGDFLIGLTALSVAASVKAGQRQRAVVWNALGIFDLVVALSLGLAASPALHLIQVTPTTKALFATPLWFAPAFAVPISFWLHIASLWGLAHQPAAQAISQQRVVSG
jgi:hypothetical protein